MSTLTRTRTNMSTLTRTRTNMSTLTRTRTQGRCCQCAVKCGIRVGTVVVTCAVAWGVTDFAAFASIVGALCVSTLGSVCVCRVRLCVWGMAVSRVRLCV